MYPGVWGNLRLKFEEIASLRVELLKRDLGSTASVLVYLDPKGYPILRVRMTKVTENSLSYMIMRVLDGKKHHPQRERMGCTSLEARFNPRSD